MYVKLINDRQFSEAPYYLDGIAPFYNSAPEVLLSYGYKLFVPLEGKVYNAPVFFTEDETCVYEKQSQDEIDAFFAEQLIQAKNNKLAENKTAYDARFKAGLDFNGIKYDCDALASQRITGRLMVILALLSQEVSAN